MRRIPLAILVGAGLAASALTASGGWFDPRLSGVQPFTCRRPELTALAKELRHGLCVQKEIMIDFTAKAPALESAARAFIHEPWKAETSPDPTAIICRNDYGDPGEGEVPIHTITCAYNSHWSERAAAQAGAYARSTPVFQTGMPAP